jgi:hypothetical protein
MQHETSTPPLDPDDKDVRSITAAEDAAIYDRLLKASRAAPGIIERRQAVIDAARALDAVLLRRALGYAERAAADALHQRILDLNGFELL